MGGGVARGGERPLAAPPAVPPPVVSTQNAWPAQKKKKGADRGSLSWAGPAGSGTSARHDPFFDGRAARQGNSGCLFGRALAQTSLRPHPRRGGADSRRAGQGGGGGGGIWDAPLHGCRRHLWDAEGKTRSRAINAYAASSWHVRARRPTRARLLGCDNGGLGGAPPSAPPAGSRGGHRSLGVSLGSGGLRPPDSALRQLGRTTPAPRAQRHRRLHLSRPPPYGSCSPVPGRAGLCTAHLAVDTSLPPPASSLHQRGHAWGPPGGYGLRLGGKVLLS